MKQSGIVGQSIGVIKQGQTILDELDFTINPGKLTGLIGPSGSGKTTLMRSIVGLQIVSSGQLLIDGAPAGAAKLRGRIGYVTQGSAIYDDLTVEQNLAYMATLKGAGKAAISKAIDQVDLANQRKQLASTLSGGQKARVSLAAALIGEPDVLILDEPTVGLDPVLRHDLWRLFASLAQAGRTIVVSSHVMDEADRCDDILLLRDGQLLWSGAGKQLLRQTGTDSTEAAFLQLVEVA